MTDVEKTIDVEPGVELDVPSNWEFIDRVPSPEEVLALLATLPKWWGLRPTDFADYVQGLPADKKVKIKDEKGRKVDEYHSVVTLYFSVAGRQQMLRAAQELHGWVVDFRPEPVTPSGVPGFLQMDGERIVYREYVEIWVPVYDLAHWQKTLVSVVGLTPTPPELRDQPVLLPDPPEITAMPPSRWFAGQEFQRLGSRPGMAWVPYSGGTQAKGSNPYEKVETAARGRALAAWGFGVLPGSGVASLEEMQGARQNAAAIAAQQQPEDSTPKQTPADLAQDLMMILEEARQITNRTPAQVFEAAAKWFKDACGLDVVKERDAEGGIVEIDPLRAKHGQLILAKNEFRKRLTEIKAELKGL